MIQSLDADVLAPGSLEEREIDLIVREIYLACGGGAVLCIGPDARALVLGFLRLGVDAFGLEASDGRAEASNLLAAGRFAAGDAASLPYEDKRFATVAVVADPAFLAAWPTGSQIDELSRVLQRSLYFRLLVGAGGAQEDGIRALWEGRFFVSGFRKHPSYYRVNDYEALQYDTWHVTLLLERIPDVALRQYPLLALSEERDLHMDMLRESGARSDAHVFRYEWAARYVRPGDTVLDAACGLGYGSYLLQTGTFAARTLGIDGSRYAVEYARRNFAELVPGLEFREGFLPHALAVIPDNSIDLVVSFETLEHVEENLALLAEFRRVLTPAGRIITSVPNDWSDESGEDPNPFHLHVYTLDRLRGELASHFMLEGLVAQSASQHKLGPSRRDWCRAVRSFRPLPIDIDESEAPDAEWWLCVAMRSPLEGSVVPYRETQFPVFDTEHWNVTAFGRDYRNPWLVRGMVDITHRVQFEPALVKLAGQVLAAARPEDPESGAALCVLAYRLLSAKDKSCAEVRQIANQINARLDPLSATPHGRRWQVSLLFVVGRLWMDVGDFTRAVAAFERCVALDPMGFSPLLCNRTVEAHLRLGLLAAAAGQRDVAARHWRAGIHQAREAVTHDWQTSVGDVDNPAEFGLPELASVLEYASSCAYALAHLDDIDVKPGWWFQPLRDRLSQSSMMSSELDAFRRERTGLLEESQRLRCRLGEAGAQLEAFETHGRLLQAELEAYREQAEAYRGQLSAAQVQLQTMQDQARAAAAVSKGMELELAAYREQSDAYRAQLSAAQVQLQTMQDHGRAAVVANEAMERELAAYREQSAAYLQQLEDAYRHSQEQLAHSLGLQNEIERRRSEAEAYALQIRAAEAASEEAAAYRDTLTRELEAYQVKAADQHEQLLVIQAQHDRLASKLSAQSLEAARLVQELADLKVERSGLQAERASLEATSADQQRLISGLEGQLAEIRHYQTLPGFMALGLVRATFASIRRKFGGDKG